MSQRFKFFASLFCYPQNFIMAIGWVPGGTWYVFCRCSVTQLCLILRDPMGCSTPGFPLLHHLLELAQAYTHWVGDSIQPWYVYLVMSFQRRRPLRNPARLSLQLFGWILSCAHSWPNHWQRRKDILSSFWCFSALVLLPFWSSDASL